MSTVKTDLLAVAKQGNPKAIAALMNRSLQPKGIEVKAFMQGDRLNIVLQAAAIPSKDALVGFIRKGLNNLNIHSIKAVKLYGKQLNQDTPIWAEEFNLDSYIEPASPEHKTIVVTSTSLPPVQQTSTRATKVPSRRATVVRHSGRSRQFPWIPISAGVGVLVLLSLGGGVFWLRSTQSNILAEAQTMIESTAQSDNSGDIQSLKANQESLQNAINLLEDAPKFPVIGIGQLTNELENAQAKLAETNEDIAAYEALLPKIQAVVDQFSALDSALDVGMNYRDYGSEVRELKVAIDRLGREPGISESPVYKELEVAYAHYDFAHGVWQYYIDSDENNNFFPASSSYGTALIEHYGVTTQSIVGRSYIYLSRALSTVWASASENVQSAQKQVDPL